MTPRETMPAAPLGAASGVWTWLGWAWVGVLLLVAAAILFDIEVLRLALDFQRHLR